jgi:hypothetical protein
MDMNIDRQTQKERERERETHTHTHTELQKITCSDLVTPARPHLLKFPKSPKIVSPAGTSLSVHEPFGETLVSKQ